MFLPKAQSIASAVRGYAFPLLLFLEAILLTVGHNLMGPYVSPLLIVVVGCGVALLPVLRRADGLLMPVGLSPLSPRQRLWALVGLAAMAVGAWVFSLASVAAVPVAVESSDVVPQVQVLVRRFLEGEAVYAPITEWGYTLHPTYITWHWAAFVPAEWFGWDYRMYALTVTAVVFAGVGCLTLSRGVNRWSLLVAAFPWLVWWGFLHAHKHDLALTIESLPACWYLLLTLSLGRYLFASAVLAGLCLLSRYAIVLWLPVWGLLQLLAFRFTKAVAAVALVLLMLAGGYILPFLLNDPDSWQRGMDYHSQAALGEWRPQGWQAPTDRPFHLFRGIGMASWFHVPEASAHPAQLALLQRVHILLSVLAALVGGGLAYRYRHRRNLSVLMAASLKLYLVFFYGFIQIPYSYLYWVPLAVSMGLLVVVYRTLNTPSSS